jgi:hypothetical protein
MYPLGHTLGSASRQTTFIYANILSRTDNHYTLEQIAEAHRSAIVSAHPMSTFEHKSMTVTDSKDIRRTALLRTAAIGERLFGREYSLYINYGDAVLLLVLLTPKDVGTEMLPILLRVAETSFVMTINDTMPRPSN